MTNTSKIFISMINCILQVNRCEAPMKEPRTKGMNFDSLEVKFSVKLIASYNVLLSCNNAVFFYYISSKCLQTCFEGINILSLPPSLLFSVMNNRKQHETIFCTFLRIC